MQLLISDELYSFLVKTRGQEFAEKIDTAIITSNMAAVFNVQKVLNGDYNQAIEFVNWIEDKKDEEIIKEMKKISENGFFFKYDIALKYLEGLEIIGFLFFAEELGAIKRIGKNVSVGINCKYQILDKDKFMFLVRFLWCQNKCSTLENWKRKRKKKGVSNSQN